MFLRNYVFNLFFFEHLILVESLHSVHLGVCLVLDQKYLPKRPFIDDSLYDKILEFGILAFRKLVPSDQNARRFRPIFNSVLICEISSRIVLIKIMELAVLIHHYPLIVKIIFNKFFCLSLNFLAIFSHQKFFIRHFANLFYMILI